MKPRESRRKLVVGARVRHDGRWADVRILDASSRGFLVSMSNVPPRGTYIELARGPLRYVARVMWQGRDRCGVQTQDRVCVDSLLKPPERAANAAATPDAVANDRRSAERVRDSLDQQGARSIWLGKSIEYLSIVGAGAMAAIFLVTLLTDAFTAPLATVSAALASPHP